MYLTTFSKQNARIQQLDNIKTSKYLHRIKDNIVSRHFSFLIATAIGFAALLWLSAWVVRPDLSTKPRTYTDEELVAASSLRDNRIFPEDRPKLHVDVDYGEGVQAQWWPKGESPILAELGDEGSLPNVAERVGPEPIVYEPIENIGSYGGTWVRSIPSVDRLRFYMRYELGCGTLLRFSPHVYPAVPHLVRDYEISDDNRVFTFYLRKIRWSDGHPFTADDIMFWWEAWATWQDPVTGDRLGWVPEIVKVRGAEGTIEKIDDHTVRYVFPEPNGIFLEFMTGARGSAFQPMPAHYLRQFHPGFGNPAKIREIQEAYQLPSAVQVFKHMRELDNNPELPTLSPWILRTYRAGGPYTLVRNPFYYAVDTAGNQLPYLDRIVFRVKNPKMVDISVVNGESSIQEGQFNDYTDLMTQQERNGYEVYHWYPAGRSLFAIALNLNRRIEPDKPETALKHQLLNNKQFHHALSLAIDRQAVIDAEQNGFGVPSQISPGEASVYHHEGLSKAFIEYDPTRANALLDDLGLMQRDHDGYRTFTDGTRMSFYLNVNQELGKMGAVQMVVEYWDQVGIRVLPREKSSKLFSTENFAFAPDMSSVADGSSYNAVGGGNFMPQNAWAPWASGWGRWYWNDGLVGSPKADTPGSIAPPVDHPIREVMRLYDLASTVVSPEERQRIYRPALDIAADQLWTISIATPPPALMVVKNGLRNVPRSVVWGFIDGQFLNAAYPDQWYWEKTHYSPGERAEIKRELQVITPRPPLAPIGSGGGVAVQTDVDTEGSWVFAALGKVIAALLVVGLLVIAVKHPYVGRRLLIMIPTLFVISVITFVIIQIPPGNYITFYIQQLQNEGADLAAGEVEEMKEMFFLNDPVYEQYARWMGLKWFVTFEEGDQGLLQGHLGHSMEFRKPVNDIVGDRILLTVLISLGTILFTWLLAVPIGIYSAVRQYSLGDYALTFLGFIGMCVPQFLLALVFIYWSDHYLGIKITGLFSSEYAVQPDWDWGKMVDLMQHIWLPIVVLGMGGTAGMIRVMRANLLDELKKPYVTTARAKGVRPLKLLVKYPVRLALNPFISGIGTLFPLLVSGGAIVAMVLSLPTVGPLMLSSLLSEDMYLAGSMLMVLSALGVFGVLVSDLLLLWLDPRIRFDERAR